MLKVFDQIERPRQRFISGESLPVTAIPDAFDKFERPGDGFTAGEPAVAEEALPREQAVLKALYQIE